MYIHTHTHTHTHTQTYIYIYILYIYYIYLLYIYIYYAIYIYIYIYILRSSYFCKIWALCVSWVTCNQFYIFGTGTFTPRHQFFIPDTSIVDIPVIIDITRISIMEVFGMKNWWSSVNLTVANMFIFITSLKTELLFDFCKLT